MLWSGLVKGKDLCVIGLFELKSQNQAFRLWRWQEYVLEWGNKIILLLPTAFNKRSENLTPFLKTFNYKTSALQISVLT